MAEAGEWERPAAARRDGAKALPGTAEGREAGAADALRGAVGYAVGPGTVVLSNSAEPQVSTASRRRFISEVTRLLAASTLARAEFPSVADLPRVAPIPRNHLGHLLLVDYLELAASVWGTALRIKEAAIRSRWRRAIVGMAVGLLLAACYLGLGGLPRLLAMAIALATGHWVSSKVSPALADEAAKLRASTIKKLLAGETPFEPDAVFGDASKMASFGDGLLLADRALVFVATSNKRPFPGLGQLQSRSLLVCRPKDRAKTAGLGASDLYRNVRATAEKIASETPETFSFGEAVVVHSGTIAKDSRWLDHAGRPRLYLDFFPGDPLGQVAGIDPRSSARLFVGVQVLWPEHATCATFLMRPFLAEDSASFEIFVMTLGPPLQGWNYVRRRLHAHRLEEEAKRGRGWWQRRTRPVRPESTLSGRLQWFRQLLFPNSDPFSKPSDRPWPSLMHPSIAIAHLQLRLKPNPAEPEPRGLPGLQAPDPGLQVKQFLEPGVWSLESLPSCARLRHEGTIQRLLRAAANRIGRAAARQRRAPGSRARSRSSPTRSRRCSSRRRRPRRGPIPRSGR
jgi:hypothetical protein